MIIASKFLGDEDLATQREQHDIYGDALRIIVSGCRDHFVRAARILGQDVPDRWRDRSSFDHRTLQMAHDLLAATWRFREDSQQLRLPLRGHRETTERRMAAWLVWLEREVESWRREPRIVQTVMLILAQQNTDAGYAAEDRLAVLLRERFCDVPWKHVG